MDEVLFYENYDHDTLDFFFANLQTSLMVNINKSGFDMLLVGDGFELLEKNLLEEISFHYNKSVQDYIVNIKELEDLEMDRLSVFMQDHLPYRTVFPSKEDFEEFPFEKLISDLRFLKESNPWIILEQRIKPSVQIF